MFHMKLVIGSLIWDLEVPSLITVGRPRLSSRGTPHGYIRHWTPTLHEPSQDSVCYAMWTLLSVTDNYITKPPFQSHCKTIEVPPPPRRSPQCVRASSLSKLHDHTQTHHVQQDSSGPVISPSQRPLPDNTRHSQETNIHAPGVIRTCNPSKQAVADPFLRLGSEQVTLQQAIFLATRRILFVRHLQQRDTQLFVSAGNSCIWKGTQKRQFHMRLT